MQLQIECNYAPGQTQICSLCKTSFVMQEAQILLCNEQGRSYGQVCPKCLGRGLNWINNQFDTLNQPLRVA